MTQLRQIEKSNFIKFRPDIEGMRAIAVLSVLLFHMGLALLRNKLMDSLGESDVIGGRDAQADTREVSNDQLARV